MCTPAWPGCEDLQVHLSAELSWEPSSRNGPEPVSLWSLFQTVGVRGSASQPSSWARAAESKRRPLLSSSQPLSTPQMGRDRTMPACLLPPTARSLPRPTQRSAHILGAGTGGQAEPSQGREPAISHPNPLDHLTNTPLCPLLSYPVIPNFSPTLDPPRGLKRMSQGPSQQAVKKLWEA